MKINGNAEVAGATSLINRPSGITTDGTSLYMTDARNRVLKIEISTNEVTTLAGGTNVGYADGSGTTALFNNTIGITNDGTNLYVTDMSNHKIRKVDATNGWVTTLAGGASAGYADGIGTAVRFNNPVGITTDNINLYVTEAGNNRIRKIVIANGQVTTLAGGAKAGYADGSGAAALFNQPQGITIDGPNLYVADFGNNLIRKIVISSGLVTTIAGGKEVGNADGSGTAALFNGPTGITTDGTSLYVSDTSNHKIRMIGLSSNMVTTLVGATAGNVNGLGTAALFYNPAGLTSDGNTLFVMDQHNHRIRKIK